MVSDKALANVFCIKAILRLATKNCFCESSQRLIQPRLVRWTDGFDRSEISVLAEEKTVAPNRGYRRAVELEDDDRAPRLPYIESESLTEGKASLVGGLFYIGAFVGAGALTASGGILASPIVAGVLTGSVAGLAGLALSKLISDRQVKWMQSQLERGGLLLWARTWTEEREREAISVMQRNGGHDVHVHAVMT
ncbi:MAG: hypothetical protein ABSD90_13275 [Methylocystis sp.]